MYEGGYGLEGMDASALRNGINPWDWRQLVWD